MIANASVVTDNPTKYIKRLCKHFAHKVAVEYDDNGGKIVFNMGKGSITKTDSGLTLQAEADNQEDLTTVIHIIDKHFVNMAWQEELTLQWINQD